MRTIKKGLAGKVCVLSGSSEGTRLVQFFRTNPGTIKIITNEPYSLMELFDRDNGYDYRQYKVQLIVNKESKIKQNDLLFMKSLLGDNFQYKYVENVWTNLFVKDTSNIVNFDLYGIGYNPYFYHAKYKEDVATGNRGVTFKLTGKEIVEAICSWFDAIWENEKMVEFEPLKFISRSNGEMKKYDGGGRYFSTTNVEISNTFDEENLIGSIDVEKFILEDEHSANISSKAKYLIYDQKITLAYDHDSNQNLCISFYDEDVIEYIYHKLRHMSYKIKDYLDNMDFFLKKKILYSHELCAFMSFNLQDKRRLLLMREHYLSIRPIDGKRKFNNTVEYIEEEYNVDLSFLKDTI